MLLIYKPEDGDPQSFPFELDRMFSFEAEALEEAGGNAWDTYEDFADKLTRGNFRARRALLWVMLKRQQPKLKFTDLVVRFDEVAFEAEDDEKAAARKMLDNPDLSDEDRTQLEALIAAEDEPGKDDSGDSLTGSESPQPATEPSPSN